MKKIIYLLIFIPFISIAQVGIGTTDPRTTLDVVGAITNREVSFAVASNAVNIATETSLANLTGAATASITVTSFTPTVNGCRLIVSNNTTGGFGASFASMTIPNGQAVEFIYTNGVWRTTAGGTGAANNIYNSNGTLTGNRTVTQGANSLTFTGTGNTIFNNGSVGIGTAPTAGKLNVSGGLVIGSGATAPSTVGIPFGFGNTTNSALWFGNYNNSASNDYAVAYLEPIGADVSILNILSGDNASGSAADDAIFIGNVNFSGTKNGTTFKNGNVGIGVTTPLAQLHSTGSVLFAGAGTPALGRSLVTDATGLATWQNPLASNSTSTVIPASATQVAVPSTNVQGAISDLATAIKTTQNSTIYTSDGALTGNRTVTQGASTLTFNSTAVNGFSVDGTTFSVDATNNRVGLGTTAPNLSLDITSGTGIGTKASNTSQWDHLYLFSDGTSSYITAGGAENGLQFRVGNGATGTYGGQTYTNAMTIMPSGNVGIGATDPQQRLDVNGNVRIRTNNTIYYQDLADYRLAIREDYETAVTGWTNNTRTTVLGQNILGGLNVLSTTPIQKTFNLTGVPHTTVKIKFSYYSVDSWDSEIAYVKVAGTGAGWQRVIINNEIMRDNIVGGAWNDGIYYGEIEVPHTANTLTLIVGSTLDQAPNDESFGIDNVEIWVR